MSDHDDIPVLNDLIERGAEITMSDLGLEDYVDDPPLEVSDIFETEAEAEENTELEFDADEVAPYAAAVYTRDTPGASSLTPPSLAVNPPKIDSLADNPALEQAVRRILDEHMELAWQEIRLAIQQHLDGS